MILIHFYKVRVEMQDQTREEQHLYMARLKGRQAQPLELLLPNILTVSLLLQIQVAQKTRSPCL